MERRPVLEACLELEDKPTLVQTARAFAASVAAAWHFDALRDDVVLVTSELVGNAVLHARSSIRVTLRSDGRSGLVVEVEDENTRMPTQASCPQDATSGRGLALVAKLSSAWGARPAGQGKVVWARLSA
jgi:anti-sigma regulatory factor (Ser/Thr protein kinase)